MSELVDEVLDLTVSAMLTDGAHHKQWFLEEIAKLVTECPMEEVEGIDARGEPYTYRRRARGPLEARLAVEHVYFDDGAVDVAEDPDGDWWVIEAGVAP
jgi:hypothetical protein